MKTKRILAAGIFTLAITFLARAHAGLYVANQDSNTVGEYDATTGAAIPGWTSPSGLNNPEGLALSGNTLYVSNYLDNTVGKYRPASKSWLSP